MTQYRKDLLINDNYYHIFSRSIAKYVIFNNDQEYSRIINLISLLKYVDFDYSFSRFIILKSDQQLSIINKLKKQNKTFVEIIAYCIMPTHFHLILKQNTDFGIAKYMAKLLNSYSKYFNAIHNRVGPLWSGRFKNLKVTDDDQLLHLTRYIHLNPCSANIVNRPEHWEYSSYKEYINESDNRMCGFKDVINFELNQYKKFVENRKDYQQKISQIKNLLIDNYSG